MMFRAGLCFGGLRVSLFFITLVVVMDGRRVAGTLGGCDMLKLGPLRRGSGTVVETAEFRPYTDGC